MANPPPVRYPSGVTNQVSTHQRGRLPFPDPFKTHAYWNDFDVYLASDWTRSLNAGTGTTALLAGDGGLLTLVNSAGATDMVQHQLAVATYSVTAATSSQAGKDMWFATRLNIDTAALGTIVAGLHTVKTSAITTAATDGFWFTKAAAGTVTFNDSTGSTLTTSSTLQTMANATYTEWAFHYFTGGAANEIRAYIDGVQVYSRTVTTAPTGNLALTFAVMNSTAAARTLNVDYVFAAKER